MNTAQGIQQIINLITANGSGKFKISQNCYVVYPGSKSSYDYKVYDSKGKMPTHTTMVIKLYNIVNTGIFTFSTILQLLQDLYNIGSHVNYFNAKLDDLKLEIFWLSLQDEINFPSVYGYCGQRMPLSRYFKAIYCADSSNRAPFNIDDVIKRTNNHGQRKPQKYAIPSPPNFYC